MGYHGFGHMVCHMPLWGYLLPETFGAYPRTWAWPYAAAVSSFRIGSWKDY
jgi:hypothetical protein